jgi:hypothetical protein
MCQGGVEVRSALPIALMVSDILSDFRVWNLLMIVVSFSALALYLYNFSCSHLSRYKTDNHIVI